MNISTRGRYAARAALYLAVKYGEGPVSLKKVSHDQDISLKYLENIMRRLTSKELIVSAKGKKGGFRLAKHPGEIKISEVVQAAEGSLAPVFCVDRPHLCSRSECCVTRDIWSELKGTILNYLDSITLHDMVKMYRTKKQEKKRIRSTVFKANGH